MKKLLLLFTLPLSVLMATAPHGHTHLHHQCHYELHTGPLGSVSHTPNHAAPFLNGTLQVSTFYEQMLGSSQVGRFIGTQPTNTTYTLAHINTASSVANKLADATNNLFVHADPTSSNSLAAKLDARPSRQCYGAILSYEQYVPFLSGWHLGGRLPLVDARTNLHLKIIDRQNATPGDLTTYFAGFYHSDTASRAQAKLEANRFDVHELQYGGAPQLELWLRKKILDTRQATVDLRLQATIPFIAPAGPQNLFTPTLGNNGHWAIGAQAGAALELWQRHNNKMVASLRGHIGYGFSHDETRVLGINNALTINPFGHYALFTNTAAAANDALVPGANILQKKVSVSPGLSYELTGTLAWSGEHTTINTGYTYHGKEAESIGTWQWKEGTYAIAGTKYDTTKTFAAQAAVSNATVTLTDAVGATHTYLQRGDLASNKAALPSHDAHTIWTQISYSWHIGILPFECQAGIAGTVGGNGWLGRPLSGWVNIRLSF